MKRRPISEKIALTLLILLPGTALACMPPPPASAVRLEVQPSQSVVPTQTKHSLYLKVSLKGEDHSQAPRSPVHVAIVLDKSSSMQGAKIQQAKEAAILAINSLGADDIVSVITYDSQVNLIYPAAKPADKQKIINAIRQIEASGATALFGGVSKGAEELRKHLSRNYVNRVILLSDGQANIGPQSPQELGSLGNSLSKEGISVTTIGLGLGYNEDLMAQLARRSGGNNVFVESETALLRAFQNEFKDVFSVAARDATVVIDTKPGVRPVRVLGREAQINGQRVEVKLDQVYARQEKFLILELEVASDFDLTQQELAKVTMNYYDLQTKKFRTKTQMVKLSRSADTAKSQGSVNNAVMASALELIALENSDQAIKLRDAGRSADAKKLLEESAHRSARAAEQYKSPALQSLSSDLSANAKKLDGAEWNKTRKSMANDKFIRETQQSYK